MYRVRLLALTIAFCGQTAWAVDFLNLDLEFDGSSTPPGDLLTLTVALNPDEPTIDFRVRAFARRQAIKEDTAPHQIKGQTKVDRAGNLVMAWRLTQDRTQPKVVKVKLAVPYNELKLEAGDYQVFYSVEGVLHKPDGAATVFEVFTETTRMSVRPGSRKLTGVLVPSQETESVSTKAYVLGPDGVARPQEVKLKLPVGDDFKEVDIDIPGHYERSRIELAFSPDAKKQHSSNRRPHSPKLVRFATNRNIVDPRAKNEKRFGTNKAAAMTYGAARVNIPTRGHKRGRLEVKSWWQKDSTKFFRIDSLSSYSLATFKQSLSDKCVLLFVHGFNTEFRWAILQTAQLAHDIHFPGVALAFSWASKGAETRYLADEKTAEKSVEDLASLLETLIDRRGDGHKDIHVIAHSMGNRILLRALRNLELSGVISEGASPIASVTLAAPDVAMNTFASLIPTAVSQSGATSFYYSIEDLALQGSNQIHAITPAGLYPFFAKGLVTVNADSANSPWIKVGHGYYASSDKVLEDLYLQIVRALPPEKRKPPLAPKELVDGFAHWRFR